MRNTGGKKGERRKRRKEKGEREVGDNGRE